MVRLDIVTLGAGSEVGRSCFLITIDDVSVLVDAGVHLTPASELERIPQLPAVCALNAVIISHYHLDHIGALPHLTEVARVIPPNCEIFMTSPTKSLGPAVCADYSRGPSGDVYIANHVTECFLSHRLRIVGCGEEFRLKDNHAFVVHTAHAGHVVGGVLLRLNYKGTNVIYTGDFSVLSDSLLAPINVPDSLIPAQGTDVVISECTHATTVAPLNRSLERVEREICNRVRRALDRGGRVLIPLFAVGRTQEIACMIRKHLGRVRMFTTSPAGHKASILSAALHRQWLGDDAAFGSLGVSVLNEGEPFPANSVVLASPAMLEGGSSLRLFAEICEDKDNLVLLTGYCNPGTVGNSIILFASRKVRDRSVHVNGARLAVECECYYSPLSNHTDSSGIIAVLRQLRPRKGLVLVHGQREKMEKFSERLRAEAVVDPECKIEIPRNYEKTVFECSGVHETSSVASREVLITRVLLTGLSLNEVAILVEELLPRCKVSRDGDVVLVSDSRGIVRINAMEGGIEFAWIADGDSGPEWLAFNPLVDSIVLAIQQSSARPSSQTQGFRYETPSAFSVSECSD